MDEETEKRFLNLISSKSARVILKYVNEHDTAQHTDLNAFMNAATLTTKLNGLLTFGLINHHLDKRGIRKEWYTITEKGKQILQHLDEMIEIVS
jgi:DNA-binding HxlR family transcriptional regulator